MNLKVGKLSLVIVLIILGLFTGGGASSIHTKESAVEKFKNGYFLAAAEEAKNLESVDGYLLAAEALIIYTENFAEKSEHQQYLLEAIELARKSVALQSENPETYAILIRGLGRYAQLLPPGKALSEGLAKELRENLDTLLELDPESWKGHLGYGFWHAEIVVKGGLPGMLLFNASRRKALFHFDRAIELKQDSIILHFEMS